MATNPAGTNMSSKLLFTSVLIFLVFTATFGIVLSIVYPDIVVLISGTGYVSGGAIYDSIYVVLTLATDALYLLGAGTVIFGAIVVTFRFLQCKLKESCQLTVSTRDLSGYLTFGLNFFIGAEIIRTVAVRSYEEFVLLFLVIISRGLFSLILYLERKWLGTAMPE